MLASKEGECAKEGDGTGCCADLTANDRAGKLPNTSGNERKTYILVALESIVLSFVQSDFRGLAPIVVRVLHKQQLMIR